MDAVIYQILHARKFCPRVFDEFKQDILSAINENLNDLLARMQPESPAMESGEAAAGQIEETTGVEKLIAFFRARGNAPASIDEMATATGKTKVTIKVIVYKRHKEKFEKVMQRGKNNAAYFRLAEK